MLESKGDFKDSLRNCMCEIHKWSGDPSKGRAVFQVSVFDIRNANFVDFVPSPERSWSLSQFVAVTVRRKLEYDYVQQEFSAHEGIRAWNEGPSEGL